MFFSFSVILNIFIIKWTKINVKISRKQKSILKKKKSEHKNNSVNSFLQCERLKHSQAT